MAKGKFKEWLTEDGLKQIESWFRDGLTDVQVATNIGISKTTFYDWVNKFPAISNAVKNGKKPVDFEVENALLKRALGYDIEESTTHISVNGKGEKTQRIVKVKKHVAPDTTAIIFWLKNRQRDKWMRRSELEDVKTEVETAKLRAELEKFKAETEHLQKLNDVEEANDERLKAIYEKFEDLGERLNDYGKDEG